MEPTESAAAGSRLRLRRMVDAWHVSRWLGQRGGGAPRPAVGARASAPPTTGHGSAPPGGRQGSAPPGDASRSRSSPLMFTRARSRS
ncbi:hypothetical protein CJI59_35760 [Streptomyces sp. Alain-F2R5]|nr:hypothetical protein CJI59_35760 [Streptomyces sp. Alain-F2R5]